MSVQDRHLFISYSRKNKDFIEDLIDMLKNQCIVWYDQRLRPAELWWMSICEEIERCDCFIFLLTEPYTFSIYCLTELEYAQQLGKPILPIIADRNIKYPPHVARSQAALIDGLDAPHVHQAFGKIMGGVSQLRPEQYTKPTGEVKRPNEPTPTGQAQIWDVYTDAVEAEAASNFPLAERFYTQVVQQGSPTQRKLAEDKLQSLPKRHGCMKQYQSILKLAARPATLADAVQLWRLYIDECSTEYDPRGFANDARFAIQTPIAGDQRTDVKGMVREDVPEDKSLIDNVSAQVDNAFQQVHADDREEDQRKDFAIEDPQHEIHITRTREEFIDKLRRLAALGWVGNRGGIGNTLEDYLGIAENNLPIPDAAEWELVARPANTNAFTTLIHIEPSPRAISFVTQVFLPSYGWKHREAGKNAPATEMSFRQTIHGLAPNDRGFMVKIDRSAQKVLISFDASKVASKHRQWLEQVEARIGTQELNPQPYWGFGDLEHRAGTRLLNCFYVQAQVNQQNSKEYYWFNKVLMLENFKFESFLRALETGVIIVDFDARTGHNYGTKFRVRSNALPSLYEISTTVIGE